MIIGLFSDTHDNKTNIEKARTVFVQEKVVLCLFAGDLVSPFTLSYLLDWPSPIKTVFGNNEGDKWGIKRRFKKYNIHHIEYGGKGGNFFEIEFPEGKAAIFHGHIPKFTELLVNSGEYILVCTGHTHVPHIKKIGATTWINSGSVTGVSEDPAIKVGTVAIFDTKTEQAKIVDLV